MSGQDLVWAVKNGDLDKVKEMVEAEGFDVNAFVEGGRSPLHLAADFGQLDVLVYLVEERKGDVNGRDKHGISVLLAAIWEGHIQCVKYLLDKGASKSGSAPTALRI